MRFGPTPLAAAEGAILAHSLALPEGRLKKGRRLSATDLARLAEAGLSEVVTARLDPTDVHEDAAAARIAHALAPEPAVLGLTGSAPFTGRANLFADAAGVLCLDGAAVSRLNELDEAITLATLPPFARVVPRQMVATVKIIPYAAPATAVAEAERIALDGTLLEVRPFRERTVGLLLTRVAGQRDGLIEKGADAVRRRLTALGLGLVEQRVVAHDPEAISAAISQISGDMILLLSGSATSDRGDVGPAGLVAAGGHLVRFGMPVDPGNLLFLGELGDGAGPRPVLGLPGCVRSPKLNGADWVLERLAAGLSIGPEDVSAMGVGGLLKEIPSRPAPRAGPTETSARRPMVAGVMLAAGAARRMRGRDKLLEKIDGQPLLTRLAAEMRQSGLDQRLAVLRPEDQARAAALGASGLALVENARAAEGMGTSIATGLRALGSEVDAALILLGDMPEITAAAIDRLIAAFDPSEGREIVRAMTPSGRAGHPVLFGRRFFEGLIALDGDRGARAILEEHAGFITDVVLDGDAAITDLDTPEAWEAWRAARDDQDQLRNSATGAILNP